MSYITQTDLETRFGVAELAQLTDRDAATSIDSEVVSRAIADAEAEVDGYLATRYALPLASAPAVLQRITADIARYRLWADGATDSVRKRYEDAVRDLRAIASGAFALEGLLAAPADSTQNLVEVVPGFLSRLFSRDSRR